MIEWYRRRHAQDPEWSAHASCGSGCGPRGGHGPGHGHRFAGGPGDEFGGGAFGVRRPLRFLAWKLERHGRNVNLLVSSLYSLGPLARQAANEAEVARDLPRAHHFGHR